MIKYVLLFALNNFVFGLKKNLTKLIEIISKIEIPTALHIPCSKANYEITPSLKI